MNRANPKLIGAFVVGAVALVVMGFLLLGGAQFLTQKRTLVAYFEGSVKGLNVGAPVEFQGVRVGAVTDIQLQFLTAANEFRIPVFIQIEPGRMTQVGRQVDMQGQLLKPLIDVPRMAQISSKMLKDALDSFVNRDENLARSVLVRDDQVDELKEQVFRELLTYMISDPATIKRAIDLILISRNLERIADHATNIAEDVVFVVAGKDIRHHAEATNV